MALRRLIKIAFGTSRRDFATKAFLGQLAFSAIAFIGSIAAARVLGPSGKGVLSGWTTFAALTAIVLGGSSTIGFGRAWLVGDRDVLVPAVSVHGIRAAVVAIAIALSAAAMGTDPLALVIFLVVTVPASVMFEDLTQVAFAAKEALQWQLPRIVNASVFTLGVVILWAGGWSGVDALVWALFGAGSVAGWALLMYSTVRKYGARRPPSGYLGGQIPDYGRGTGPFRVMNYILLRLDWFVVLFLVGSAGLGLYGIAANWVEIGIYFAASIGAAVFEDTRTLSDTEARRLMRRSAVVVGPVGVALALLAWPLIPGLFGADFTAAREVVPLLVPGLVGQALSRPAWQILVARGEGVLVRSTTMKTLIVSAPVLLILAAAFGVHGAAVGSSLAHLIWAWMLGRQFSGCNPQNTDVGTTG